MSLSDRQHRGVVGEPEFSEALGDSPQGSVDQRLDVATGRDADRGSSREWHPRILRDRRGDTELRKVQPSWDIRPKRALGDGGRAAHLHRARITPVRDGSCRTGRSHSWMGKVRAPGRTRTDASGSWEPAVPHHFAPTKVARAIIAIWPDGTVSLIRTSPPSSGTTTTSECLLTLTWWALSP